MDLSKYDGNIHPDEWINDVQKYFKLKNINDNDGLKIAKSLVDPIVSLPDEIDSLEKFRNALKEDISFIVFKCTNKRLLKLLKYIPEKEGGNTSKFISDFCKLCYNSEINDIGEQKNYFCNTLPNEYDNYDCYSYFLEFIKRREKINSINDLIKEFIEIITDELNLIRNESIIALKHVATGKYLSSIDDLYYTTGSKCQLVFAGNSEPDLNALWRIKSRKELVMYDETSKLLTHIESGGDLELCYDPNVYTYYKSPITEHTEVCCDVGGYIWNFKHSKSENHQRYLKSNDIIYIKCIKKSCINDTEDDTEDDSEDDPVTEDDPVNDTEDDPVNDTEDDPVNDTEDDPVNTEDDPVNDTVDDPVEFLRSHDVQFTIGNNNFQEVVCHNEKLGENDEWRIELIKRVE